MRIYAQIYVPDPRAQAALRERLEAEPGWVIRAGSDEIVDALLPWEFNTGAADEPVEQARVELGFWLRSFLLDWPDLELDVLVERAVEIEPELLVRSSGARAA